DMKRSTETEDRYLHMISRTSTAGVLCAATLFLLAGCSPDGAATGAGELDTEDARASYGIGYNVGSGLAPLADRVDNAAFERGFRDALAEADPAIPEDPLQQALMSFQLELQQSQQAAMAAEAETNQAAADSFMAEVRERDGVTTTESGLAYEVVEPGDGSTPSAEDEVTLHYHGTLVDGTTFDSSRDRGQP